MVPLKTPGSRPLRPHLFTALLLSLLGHGLVLFSSALKLPPPPPAPLTVDLPPTAAPIAEPLLKNTLETAEPAPAKPADPPPQGERNAPAVNKPATSKNSVRNPVEAAQRKLAQHLYYPPQAIAAGLEGEVRLLLSLDPTGRIVDAEVAASSGHAILDQAALRAAWAMGSLSGVEKKEMILPVVFRLR
ncbi:hypothetical protein DLREEDagrD3_28130 [Denitratisoma sp. agr-D3]